jgi:hypothetical protein
MKLNRTKPNQQIMSTIVTHQTNKFKQIQMEPNEVKPNQMRLNQIEPTHIERETNPNKNQIKPKERERDI